MKQNNFHHTAQESYPQTPLSPSRIKELTMKKIAQEKKPHSRVRFRVLLAAAIVAMLAVTAVAAENLRTSQWFQGILNQELQKDQAYVEENNLDYTVQETVSQEQMDILDALGEGFQPQTVTDNGATMTLTAGYGDDSVMHLYLQVTAPEGTVLPDGIWYDFYDFDNDVKFDENHDPVWLPVMVKEGAPYKFMENLTCDIEPLPDEDPTDNKKDFHLFLRSASSYDPYDLNKGRYQDSKFPAFNDGVPKTLNCTGLYQQVDNVDGDRDGYVPFFTGEFIFDITYSAKLEKKEVDMTGMAYSGHVKYPWTHPEGVDHYDGCEPYDENGVHIREYDYSVTPTYFAISPMSVNYAFEYTCTDKRVLEDVQFKVVMKDGTSPMIEHAGPANDGSKGYATKHFHTPIDLSQVDYILIGNPEYGTTHKAYLP